MQHNQHNYLSNTQKAEFRTKLVMILTAVMMLAEIIAGTVFNSIALLADGWHMGTHMSAFILALITYYMARKHQNNPRFSFGTGKIGVLGGFASAILLLIVAVAMIFESINRLFDPSPIQFGEALVVAGLGLVVNLITAVLLHDADDASHNHGHTHAHSHKKSAVHSDDKNLKAAYIHVIADAFTSVTAIVALVIGYFSGILWIDTLMGFVASLVISIWAYTILKDTIIILLDYLPVTSDLDQEIHKAFDSLEATKIVDLHIWQLSPEKYSAIISLETSVPKPIEEYHALISMHEELVHLSIQVLPKSICEDPSP